MKNIALYLLAFISFSASAFDEFLITDIRIVGLQRVSIGSIFTEVAIERLFTSVNHFMLF